MAATDNPTVSARRSRLRKWIQEKFAGSRKAFLEDVAARGSFLDPTEVSNLQTGKKSFGEKKAEQIELAAGMPKDYLVRPLAEESDPWADVIGYSQAVGLGAGGAEAVEYAETHSLKFKKSSLRRRGILNRPLAVYYGKGDSMEPAIKDGDAILFDASDTRVVDGALYVIQVDGAANPEYYVKRAEVLDDGTVLFRTDNPAGDHNWRRSKRMDSKKHPITVIGRVHWIGGWAD